MRCLKSRSSSAGVNTKSFHTNFSLLCSHLLAKVCKYLYHNFFFLLLSFLSSQTVALWKLGLCTRGNIRMVVLGDHICFSFLIYCFSLCISKVLYRGYGCISLIYSICTYRFYKKKHQIKVLFPCKHVLMCCVVLSLSRCCRKTF